MAKIDIFKPLKAFVLEWLTCDTAFRHALFKPQSYFVLDGANNPKLDFIGRFEQLATHWEKIRQIRPGLEPLQKSNGMERPNFRDCFDPEMMQVVEHIYRLDLENFGYAFEDAT